MDVRALIILTSIFAASLITAQFLAGEKVVLLLGLAAPAGFLPYAVTFLITDIVGEVYGRETARRIVEAGLYVNLLLLFYIFVAHELPGLIGKVKLAPVSIVVASLIAYAVSQTLDVHLFHKLRQLTETKHLWLRNNLSTIISQAVDTTIFITLAFYILPTLGVPGMKLPLDVVGQMILTQWLAKVIAALCDTPFCYLAVHLLKKSKT